jgi:hypothetical protein
LGCRGPPSRQESPAGASMQGPTFPARAGMNRSTRMAFRAALLVRTRERVPLEWAATRKHDALRAAAEGSPGTASDATFTLATPLGAQALAMRGVLPTRLSAVVEAATMDVLCAAPPLADGASAASWRNHLATHGRTLKLGSGTCQSVPLSQKLQNCPFLLGMVYEARGENRQAADCYRKVIAFISEHPDDYEPGFEQVFVKLVDRLDPPTAT